MFTLLHVVTCFREHDKDPDLFFEVLKELKEGGHKFKVSVLGEQYQKNPGEFINQLIVILTCVIYYTIATTQILLFNIEILQVNIPLE